MSAAPTSSRERWIGVYIGILAMLLAICAMGGGNMAKDAARYNLDAANLWAFFQAKNMRRASYILAADDLELQLKANPAMPEEARRITTERVAEYRKLIAVLTSDKERNEGLDELWQRAKDLEARRDAAAQRDPYFDFGEVFLQVAIVLASIALITGGNTMLVVSFAMATVGGFLTLNGFTMVAPMAMIG